MGNFELSLIASALGIGVVFGALAVLILCISAFNAILNRTTKSEAKQPEQEITITSEVDAEPVEDKKKIIAAITAALTVAAYSQSNVRFIVKKIRKI